MKDIDFRVLRGCLFIGMEKLFYARRKLVERKMGCVRERARARVKEREKERRDGKRKSDGRKRDNEPFPKHESPYLLLGKNK